MSSILSLRTTIGSLTAIVVILVTTVSMTLTLSVSLDALRAIGVTHAGALVHVASLESSAFVRLPETQALSMANASLVFSLPSDEPPNGATVLRNYHLVGDLIRLADFQVSSVAVFFSDLNQVAGQSGWALWKTKVSTARFTLGH